jgi:hypothetical protein
MSLFNDASIIITPNGFKAGKLYAVKGADLDVTRATGANRINPSGANETMGANVPRIDYTGGGCPSILVEPQRTNLVLYSQDISNAAWTKFTFGVGASNTFTQNYGISPDGTQNATRIQLLRNGSPTSSSGCIQTFFPTAGTSFTVSVWLKSLIGNTNINLGYGTSTNGYNTNVDITNEWQRFTYTTTAGAFNLLETQLTINGTSTAPANSLSADFLAWGYQYEAGSYATSYIPTTSASVTRNADVISKTGISSLIGQTEGTVFIDFVAKGGNINHEILGITLTGGGAEYIALYSLTNGQLYFINNIIGSGILIASSSFNNRYKIAYSYSSGNHKLYVNGSQIYSSTSSSVYSLLNAIYLGANAIGSGIELLNTNTTAFWKTRISNSELATLTTI